MRKTGRVVGISTGIKRFDEVLNKGGWYKKELYVIMAPPKQGKTMSLLWFANMAMWQGFKVVFFTFETSIEILSDRLDACNAAVEVRYLPDRLKIVAEKLKRKKPEGDINFYEYPTKTCTVSAWWSRSCASMRPRDARWTC